MQNISFINYKTVYLNGGREVLYSMCFDMIVNTPRMWAMAITWLCQEQDFYYTFEYSNNMEIQNADTTLASVFFFYSLSK